MSCQLRAPTALPPREWTPGTCWVWGWVDPRAGLDDLEKRKFLTLLGLELRYPVVKPVANCYTDYATPAPYMGLYGILNMRLGYEKQEMRTECW
jgi:hypothetical protein